LYSELGMISTWELGEKPAYMGVGILRSSLVSVVQGLKQLGRGLALKAGNQKQVGGEFLFEPEDVRSPINEPGSDKGFPGLNGGAAAAASTNGQVAAENGTDGGPYEEKKITWCHRMRTTRDHAEMPELMEVLGLDGQGKPSTDDKRWTKALESRKGTGLSLASQMKASNGADAALAKPEDQKVESDVKRAENKAQVAAAH
jgi:hypothetical protein